MPEKNAITTAEVRALLKLEAATRNYIEAFGLEDLDPAGRQLSRALEILDFAREDQVVQA